MRAWTWTWGKEARAGRWAGRAGEGGSWEGLDWVCGKLGRGGKLEVERDEVRGDKGIDCMVVWSGHMRYLRCMRYMREELWEKCMGV